MSEGHRSGTGAKLEVRRVSHAFPDGPTGETLALSDINLSFRDGDFVCIVGPSGCGKTTLFNIIAGLLLPTAGSVFCDGQDISGRAGVVGYQLQKDLLLPWRTVIDNVILGLEIHGTPKSVARQRVVPLLKRYGLGGFERHYPDQLSGGMRQRAALLRTLLYDRDVILFDEPFAALDAQTRAKMQEWLLVTWGEFKKTILFVTHDIEEAVFLSDSIYILTRRPGRIVTHVPVPLPRPRNRQLTLTDEFLAIRRAVAGRIDELSEDFPEGAAQ
jgi:ABC-type nitrate/sulfonate/bicarbonate transport system ATPase subunit